MKQVNAVEFGKHYMLVRYTDDTDPPWVTGRELAIDWRKVSNVGRLAHVGYHVFHLFVNDPGAVARNDEILQEWLGRLLDKELEDDHERP